MLSSNHRRDQFYVLMGAQGMTVSKPIVISNDVWMGPKGSFSQMFMVATVWLSEQRLL